MYYTSRMTWDYRTIKNENGVAIHSVFYDAQKNPVGCSTVPVVQAKNMDLLFNEIERLIHATEKELLEATDIPQEPEAHQGWSVIEVPGYKPEE